MGKKISGRVLIFLMVFALFISIAQAKNSSASQNGHHYWTVGNDPVLIYEQPDDQSPVLLVLYDQDQYEETGWTQNNYHEVTTIRVKEQSNQTVTGWIDFNKVFP